MHAELVGTMADGAQRAGVEGWRHVQHRSIEQAIHAQFLAMIEARDPAALLRFGDFPPVDT